MTSSKKDRVRDATAQRVYAATRPTNLVSPRTHVNSTMTGSYQGMQSLASRTGSEDFLALKSRGATSPQLVINSLSSSVR